MAICACLTTERMPLTSMTTWQIASSESRFACSGICEHHTEGVRHAVPHESLQVCRQVSEGHIGGSILLGECGCGSTFSKNAGGSDTHKGLAILTGLPIPAVVKIPSSSPTPQAEMPSEPDARPRSILLEYISSSTVSSLCDGTRHMQCHRMVSSDQP
ncbi:hypothetical protein BKA81DRAFT_176099 [Phyllosticta paracitricarpa]